MDMVVSIVVPSKSVAEGHFKYGVVCHTSEQVDEALTAHAKTSEAMKKLGLPDLGHCQVMRCELKGLPPLQPVTKEATTTPVPNIDTPKFGNTTGDLWSSLHKAVACCGCGEVRCFNQALSGLMTRIGPKLTEQEQRMFAECVLSIL